MIFNFDVSLLLGNVVWTLAGLGVLGGPCHSEISAPVLGEDVGGSLAVVAAADAVRCMRELFLARAQERVR